MLVTNLTILVLAGFIGFAVTELVLLMCFVISIMIMKG